MAKEPADGQQEGIGKDTRLRNGSSSKFGPLSSKRFLKTPSKPTVVRLDEHIDDEEDDLEIDMPKALLASTEPTRSSNFSVEIPLAPSSEHAISQRYQGNANLHPSRTRPSQSLRTQQEKQGHPESASTKSGPTTKAKSSVVRNSGSSIRNRESITAQGEKFDPDGSIDELSVDYFNKRSEEEVAQELLKKQKESRKNPPGSMGNVPASHAAEVVDSESEDEISREESNIKPTKFQAGKDRRKNLPEYQTLYEVVYAGTEVKKWLFDPAQPKWSLLHDSQRKHLDLIDDNGNVVWSYLTSQLDKIRYHTESPIVILHIARDLGSNSGIHIHIELKDSDRANELRQALKKDAPTAQCWEKTS